mgnify:CR=1 FL=1
MKKVILNLAMTLDGFIEGPNSEIDWCILDEDMDFDGFVAGIDTIFYGRISYDTWGTFKPDDYAGEADKKLWKEVHSKKKYVFSHQERKDGNVTFISSDIVAKVKEIKQQPGGDIWLYGGASLIKTFIEEGLVDIYMISVHPVALGRGKPLFEDLQRRLNLKLVKADTYKSGVVQIIYEPC